MHNIKAYIGTSNEERSSMNQLINLSEGEKDIIRTNSSGISKYIINSLLRGKLYSILQPMLAEAPNYNLDIDKSIMNHLPDITGKIDSKALKILILSEITNVALQITAITKRDYGEYLNSIDDSISDTVIYLNELT